MSDFINPTKTYYIHLADLLPCPFCGGAASPEPITDYGGIYMVECAACKAEGPIARSEAEAIASWNRRAGVLVVEVE